MKLKILGILGLILLIINQVLLLKGNEYIQTQSFDVVHWLLLIGVLLSLSLNHVFSDNHFSEVATILTSLGVVALIGQATIDFIWWSYGTNYEGMNNLTQQIMSRSSIRIPFVTLGPALFYIGLAVHALKLIKKYPLWAVVTFISVTIIGVSAFAYDSRIGIIWGHILLTIGIGMLVYRKNVSQTTISYDQLHN